MLNLVRYGFEVAKLEFCDLVVEEREQHFIGNGCGIFVVWTSSVEQWFPQLLFKGECYMPSNGKDTHLRKMLNESLLIDIHIICHKAQRKIL